MADNEEELFLLRQELLTLQEDFDEFQSQSRDYEAELEAELEALREAEGNALKKVVNVESQMERLRAEYQQSKQSHNNFLRTKEALLDTLTSENAEFKTKNRALEVDNDKYERKLRVLTAQEEARNEQLEELQEEKLSLAMDLEELGEDLVEVEQLRASVKSNAERHSMEIHKLKKDTEEQNLKLNVEIKCLKEELESKAETSISLEETKKSNERLLASFNELKLELEKQQEQFDKQIKEQEQLRQREIERMNEELQNSERKRKAFEEEQKKIREVREEQRIAKETLDKLRSKKRRATITRGQGQEAVNDNTEDDEKKLQQAEAAYRAKTQGVRTHIDALKKARMVVDRLTDASNFTGVARAKFLDNLAKKNRTESESFLKKGDAKRKNSHKAKVVSKPVYVLEYGNKRNPPSAIVVARSVNTIEKLCTQVSHTMTLSTGPSHKLYKINGEQKTFVRVKRLAEIDADQLLLSVGALNFNPQDPDLSMMPREVFDWANEAGSGSQMSIASALPQGRERSVNLPSARGSMPSIRGPSSSPNNSRGSGPTVTVYKTQTRGRTITPSATPRNSAPSALSGNSARSQRTHSASSTTSRLPFSRSRKKKGLNLKDLWANVAAALESSAFRQLVTMNTELTEHSNGTAVITVTPEAWGFVEKRKDLLLIALKSVSTTTNFKAISMQKK